MMFKNGNPPPPLPTTTQQQKNNLVTTKNYDVDPLPHHHHPPQQKPRSKQLPPVKAQKPEVLARMEDLPDAWSRKAHSHRCDCRALRGPWKAQPSVDLMQRVTAPRHLGQAMTNRALNTHTHTQLHCSTRTVHAYISVTVSTTVQVFASNKRMVTAAPAAHCSNSYCTSISVTLSTTVPAFASNKMFIDR